ncbi:transposase [Streptosporangium canum]|uniref:IS1634 family transposase n=1 Tax=Streptosporangium canum TaxID=324952 RepID=UPI003698F53A
MEIEVFRQTATLLDLEVDLLFFDTTSTYFEIEDADEPVVRDERGHPDADGQDPERVWDDRRDVGFRIWGKSTDSREDLPQIVIGVAVTRTGIPVRVWCWPGNTGDQALIRQVKDDMRDWTLSRIGWVADRGFSSAESRCYLRKGDHHYIIGEKLRSDSPEIKAALSRQGRYTDITGNLRVKEVKVSEHERFIIYHNPDGAVRDAAIRDELVTKLEEVIDGSDALNAHDHGVLHGKISTKPGLHRFLRVTPGGLLRIDKAKVKNEANLDGKYLLRCSDPHLSPEDIAIGYKQLLEVERGWRDMKSIIDLRPVCHRLEERIRAHVVLCWLALLLIRIAENSIGNTWPSIRRHLDRLHVGTFTGPAGLFRRRTELSKPQRDLLGKLGLAAPKQIVELKAPN